MRQKPSTNANRTAVSIHIDSVWMVKKEDVFRIPAEPGGGNPRVFVPEVAVFLIASTLVLEYRRLLLHWLPNSLSGTSQLHPNPGYERPCAEGFSNIVIGPESQSLLQ